MAKTETRVLKRKVKKLTYGITDVLMNALLYLIYVTISLPGKSGPPGINKAFWEADELISSFDAERVRKALYNLQQQGFISSVKGVAKLPKITEAGLRRIHSRFPVYDDERVWDEKLYLITYDIPTTHNQSRDFFRGILVQLNAIKFQDSVYLTPYNPREIIQIVTENQQVFGQILISTLHPHDAFGTKTNTMEILWVLTNLEEVNESYADFIRNYRSTSPEKAKKQKAKIAFTFMSILEDDPQLPFKLLPDRYLGDEAYLLFRKLLKF